MIDLHMHTTFSDGKNHIIEMIEMAESLGLRKIAITDHIWRTSEWFDEYYEIIKEENQKREIEILVGFEAKALSVNGEIDASEYMCQKADIRIGAIHRIPIGIEINKFMTREEVALSSDQAYVNWLTTTQNLIKNENVDIIAHPCMVLYKYEISPLERDLYDLFILAKEYNTKLEISSRYKRTNKILLKILEQYPVFCNYISYGSDAHSIEDLKKVHG